MSGKRNRQQMRKHLSASRSSRVQDESTAPSTSRISEIYMTDDESSELGAEEIVVEPDHVHLSFDNIHHDKIIYQPSPTSRKITLDRHSDLICLNRTAYLNDNIISFYLTYLKYQHPKGDKIHIFDTFFFAKMLQTQEEIKGDPTQANHLYQNSYEEVARWTSNIDIFEFDFLIVPIFKDKHWMVAFVCYPGKLIESTIDLESNERACIVFFDSLNKLGGLVLKQYAQSLKTFVQEEMFKKNASAKILTNDDLPVLNPKVPAQTTDYDCGIFLLHYAEKFLENPGVIFNNKRLAAVKLNKWFEPSELAHKRIEIASLIEDIYQKSDKSMYRTSMSEESQVGDISVLSENVSNQASTSRAADLSGATGSSSHSQARLNKKMEELFGKNAEIPIDEYPADVSSKPLDAYEPDVFSIFDEPFSSDFGDPRPPAKSTANQEPERRRELKVSRKATMIEDLVDLSESSPPPKDERRFTPLQPAAKKAKTSHYIPGDFEGLVDLECEDEEE